MPGRRVIAIDLGASSGRVIGVSFASGHAEIDAVHRFENNPVERLVGDAPRWCWDVDALQQNIDKGMAVVSAKGPVDSIAVDSWGVDYGLVDDRGELVQPVTAYRDGRHHSAFERLRAELGEEAIYARTGIQFQPFNTLYQLASDAVDPTRPLDRASRMLMMPDLMAHHLCGSVLGERTNASTTQCFDLQSGDWIEELLVAAGIPRSIMPETVAGESAAELGTLKPELAEACGLPARTPVRATASHDTAAAFAAAPLREAGDVCISSGTWSLIGLELDEPIRSDAAFTANFTNEGGVFGTVRFIRNVAGLWLLQESRRQWAESGSDYDWNDLQAMAEAEPPFRTVFDPDAAIFASPGDMPGRIVEEAARLGEPVPASHAQVVRAILDSLALRYATTIDQAGELSARTPTRVVVVGGGSANTLLNQLTAATTGLEVWLGPTEATAMGNALVQLAAMDGMASSARLREHLPRAVLGAAPDARPELFPPMDDARARFDRAAAGRVSLD
ncbi:MAG: rhamnulokinase [Phycisphaerales bacterium]|nr:rhamnulokinase [Phycisphaerales bacterium]